MLVKLPESAPDRKRSFGGTALSTLIHALLIGGSITATGRIAQQALEPPKPETVIYVPPPEAKPEVTPPETRQQMIPTDVDLPPAPAIDKVIDLGEVPNVIPPPNTRIGNTSIDDFRVSSRDSLPVGPSIPATGQAYTELMVEQVVKPREGNPAPRYPSMLASAGVEGIVYARFIVDTSGRVEAESITFTKSDHQLFERSVREVLLRSRFSPAQVGNHAVRQLVEQAFSFALRR